MPLGVIGSRQAWAGELITLILISERKHIGCWPGLSYVGLVLGFQFLNSPFVFCAWCACSALVGFATECGCWRSLPPPNFFLS